MLVLTKRVVEVVGSGGGRSDSAHKLLALVATHPPSTPSSNHPADDPDGPHSLGRFDDVLVYLHGFPDMAVHPLRPTFASRLPRKIAESWLGGVAPAPRRRAVVAFNFGGVPGSDGQLRFSDKTIGKELKDAVAVCEYVRRNLLRVSTTEDADLRSGDTNSAKLHVVGLSTGAIVASLLRDKRVADTIAVIAGLLNIQRGVAYDFSPQQLAQLARDGACWKEFYLPEGSPLPRGVALSLNGETPAGLTDTDSEKREGDSGSEGMAPRKLFIRLGRAYVDECRSGELDIARAVAGSPPLPPFLVIHGDADVNVPVHDGEELFAAANDPKRFVRIPNANHLLSNAKHLKKALNAIAAHTAS
ncbi:hypothetical protein PybrP1_010490 [[Pythium] brassicae (nom. inval.)]|nr:hypothetical protein PybrP1_010490 [[Pythium] brassicae (nom. inval.)]